MHLIKASIPTFFASLLLFSAGSARAQSSYSDLTSDDTAFYFDDYGDVEDYANCPSSTTIVDDIYALNLGASSGEVFYPDTALAQMAISNGDYGTWQMNHYITWLGTRPAGNCGIVANYQLVFSVPIMHIQAYYYYTNQYSKTDGKYEVLYKRCNPIGTTCDSCSITFGSPPFAPYALFDGGEIHVLSLGVCSMMLDEAVTKCYSPEPIPGSGPGTAKSRVPKGRAYPASTPDVVASRGVPHVLQRGGP